MNRNIMIDQMLDLKQKWDLIIIGGGATGLGAAIEAGARGLKTILLEQHDFAKGTSSRSTKLVHGGVRYLAQGNIALVMEALRERGLLKKNAPHLVKDQSFIIPNYKWWDMPFYTIGLMIYDFMAGRLSLGKSRAYSKKSTLLNIPTLIAKDLCGGVVYHDGQFDDSRLAINMAQTFIENGGTALNYMKVSGLLKKDGKISGVKVIDQESGSEYEISSEVVLNATGIFVDNLIKMDDDGARKMVSPSQGVHLVVDKSFVPGDFAIMIPKTRDGRVLFAVPWHGKVVIGTTDVKKEDCELEPKPLDEEIDFILETAGRFLAIPPKREDIRSVFAGLRPLVAPKNNRTKTKEISRGHSINISKSGLVTIFGGKWTTYRQMAEDVINKVIINSILKAPKANTKTLKIHGYKENADFNNPLYFYGSDEENILSLIDQDAALGELISEKLNIVKAQVVWGVCNEMARTVEDFLARRTRALLLDAKESVKMAPMVAKIMAAELHYNETWEMDQINEYKKVAKNYILQ